MFQNSAHKLSVSAMLCERDYEIGIYNNEIVIFVLIVGLIDNNMIICFIYHI